LFDLIDKLIKVISEGSYGYVCSALNIESNEKIAIKFYKPQKNDDCIEKEIQIGFNKRLICPYIITFKDKFTFSNDETDGEFMCVSMELMDSSLEDLLNSSESMLNTPVNYYFLL
jgi:serine/threonine protein kinase